MKIHIKPWSQDPGLSDWPWFAWDRGDGRGTGQPPASHWGGELGGLTFSPLQVQKFVQCFGQKMRGSHHTKAGGGSLWAVFFKVSF